MNMSNQNNVIPYDVLKLRLEKYKALEEEKERLEQEKKVLLKEYHEQEKYLLSLNCGKEEWEYIRAKSDLDTIQHEIKKKDVKLSVNEMRRRALSRSSL